MKSQVSAVTVVRPNYVELEYVGGLPNTREYKGKATGKIYRFGNNTGHRIQRVHRDDAYHLLRLKGQFVQVGIPSAPPPEIENLKLRQRVEQLEAELKDANQAYDEIREVLTWIAILGFAFPYKNTDDWQDFDIDPYEGPIPNEF